MRGIRLKKNDFEFLKKLITDKIEYCEEHQERSLNNKAISFWNKQIRKLQQVLIRLEKELKN